MSFKITIPACNSADELLRTNQLKQFKSQLIEMGEKKKDLLITISEKSKRSNDANAKQHAMIREIAKESGTDFNEMVNILKLDFALPILLEEESEAKNIIEFFLKKIDFYIMHRKRQLKAISMLNVSSVMSKSSHVKYIEQLEIVGSDFGITPSG